MPFAAREVWSGAKPALAGLWRLAGAALLAYAFILVLITASLQESVSERLAGLKAPLDYSTGYSMWREAEEDFRAGRALERRKQGLRADIGATDTDQYRFAAEWEAETEPVFAFRRRLKDVEGCGFLRETDELEVGLAGALSDISSCMAQGTLSAAQRNVANDLLGRSASIKTSVGELERRMNDFEQLNMDLAGVNESIAALTARAKENPAREDARKTFGELEHFADDSLFGGSVISEFPPAVLSIVMSFVSGMFGALLITLVLVVYPKNILTVSMGGAGYEARIFLGGLISICVFVVLGGGTAVLGTSGGFGDGDANFLAFCAIGILAGMFSDRVAQWLSGRADAFFSHDEQPEQGPEPAVVLDRAVPQQEPQP